MMLSQDRTHYRRGLRRALLFVLVLFLGHMPPPAAAQPASATVMVPELNLRSGPGLHHPAIAVLRQGVQVPILSYEGEWVRIAFEGKSGFVLNREGYLRIDEAGAVGGAAEGDTGDGAQAALKRRLADSKQKVATFSSEEAAIIASLDDTEKGLADARRQVSRLSTELKTVETQIRDIEKRYRTVERRARTSETYVAGRLAALYKLSWLGKFNVLASADTMFDFFTRKRSMEQILEYDDAVMHELSTDMADMQALLTQLVARKNEKQATTADLSAKIDTMNAEQSRREALLAEIRGKKSLQLAAIASLEASSKELDRTVAALKPAPLPEAKPAPDSGPSSLPAPAEKPFSALKGLLMMPVKGKVISFFGRYRDSELKVTNFQSGINIKADRGEPIRAVYNGKTLFSSWFRGFGNMIIIDHGDHYYTVYAHLEEVFKSKGDPVETGEVIATVGDTGSLSGAGLHFEVRHHGKPMNPLGWIKKG